MTATVSTFFILRVSGREIYLVSSKWKVERLLYLNWILHLPPMTPRTPQTGVGHNWSCPGHGEISEKSATCQEYRLFFQKKELRTTSPSSLSLSLSCWHRKPPADHDTKCWEVEIWEFWVLLRMVHLYTRLNPCMPVVCLQPNRYKNTFAVEANCPNEPVAQSTLLRWPEAPRRWIDYRNWVFSWHGQMAGGCCVIGNDQGWTLTSRSVYCSSWLTMQYTSNRCCWLLPIF